MWCVRYVRSCGACVVCVVYQEREMIDHVYCVPIYMYYVQVLYLVHMYIFCMWWDVLYFVHVVSLAAM